VRGIIELGRSVGLRVMAEGVENHDQWQALQQAGFKLFRVTSPTTSSSS